MKTNIFRVLQIIAWLWLISGRVLGWVLIMPGAMTVMLGVRVRDLLCRVSELTVGTLVARRCDGPSLSSVSVTALLAARAVHNPHPVHLWTQVCRRDPAISPGCLLSSASDATTRQSPERRSRRRRRDSRRGTGAGGTGGRDRRGRWAGQTEQTGQAGQAGQAGQ